MEEPGGGHLASRRGAEIHPREPAVGTVPAMHGLRVVIDPGHGGIDLGEQAVLEAAWTLDVGTRLAALCRSRGAQAVLTRRGEDFVPRALRRAFVRECRPDVVISLHLHQLPGQSQPSVHFGLPAWRAGRARTLGNHIAAHLGERRAVASSSSAYGLHAEPCDGLGGGWNAVPLLVVALAAQAAHGEPAAPAPPAWAEAIADGVTEYVRGLGRISAGAMPAPPPAPDEALPPVEATPPSAALPPVEVVPPVEVLPPTAPGEHPGAAGDATAAASHAPDPWDDGAVVPNAPRVAPSPHRTPAGTAVRLGGGRRLVATVRARSPATWSPREEAQVRLPARR